MCIICLELLKHRMTINEAERAASEMVWAMLIDDPEKFDYKDYQHRKRLKEALENLDLDKLGKVLDEGENG